MRWTWPVWLVVWGCGPQDPTAEDGCPDRLDADGDGLCDGADVDWSAEATVPEGTDRGNLYGYDDAALFDAVRMQGLETALVWPVDVSGVLLPYEPMAAFLSEPGDDPDRAAYAQLARTTLGFGTMAEMYDWLGLVRFPAEADAVGVSAVPYPQGLEEGDAMGAGWVERDGVKALTFSCATCHVGDLFGRPVVGMTNRRAKANEFFHLAQGFFPDIPAETFQQLTGATDDEIAMFARTQEHFGAVAAKEPEVLGLDTSLAQVGLSLAKRGLDTYATRDPQLEGNPRSNPLSTFVADSKPAVWWTLKHKTRWLADGSIVSGNPIFTNYLWNELGRGTDLDDLEQWMRDNREGIDALTAAVFATEAPRYADWFGAEAIDEAAAMRGQAHFEAMCSECHGSYDKGWDAEDAGSRAPADRLATVAVRYHEQTPVMDVGTDPQRAEGMTHFAERLNELAISKWMKTVVEVQDGYVPPPLTGIWARYPYLHNQSVPTLCALLTPAADRPSSFWMGPSADAETDFDDDCVGFPTGDEVPVSWTDDPHAYFDTTQPCLSNEGHEAMLLDGGEEILDAQGKADLIAFLKTL